MKSVRCIVIRDNKILMLKHKYEKGNSFWSLPGGMIEDGETPEQAAIRELKEECQVVGKIIQSLCHSFAESYEHELFSFLIDIGEQTPYMGKDPEFNDDNQVIQEIKWCSIDELSERERFFLWNAGLGGIKHFFEITQSWR